MDTIKDDTTYQTLVEHNENVFDFGIMWFLDNIGRLQTAWGIIFAAILLMLFIFSLFMFRKTINKHSVLQIRTFVSVKKYVRRLYTELNFNLECLRFVIFGGRWKHRIIWQYNQLFKGYEGKRLKATFGNEYAYKLSYWSSIKTVQDNLNKFKRKFEEIRSERNTNEYGEYYFVIMFSAYEYLDSIRRLNTLCELVQEKNIVVVGSAGNGKTNLLCRFTEIAMSNKMPCLLINARDIKQNCAKYVLDKLPFVAKRKNFQRLYLRIVSLGLFLRRRKFFIVIDAINENDNREFVESLGEFLRYFLSYRNIKIILSCRSEYFDSRFKTFFADCDKDVYIHNLALEEYNSRASEKMIQIYREYYNVQGVFSSNFQEKLLRSLFLMRIFFEVSAGKPQESLEFRNAEIYKQYINKVTQSHGESFKINIAKVVTEMLRTFNFDKIDFSVLSLQPKDVDLFRATLDDNLVISRTEHGGTGITERTTEYVYFVFDELRDFCLAKELLSRDEIDEDVNYANFFCVASKLFDQRLSPTEGVLKYAYHHFMSIGKVELCKSILDRFGEADMRYFVDIDKRWRNEQQRDFNNFGLSLIFMDYDNAKDFEFDYICSCVEKNNVYFWGIFGILLRNEYSSIELGVETALDVLLHFQGSDTYNFVLTEFFRFDEYDYSDNYVDGFCNAVERIKEQNGDLSLCLKQFIVILMAYSHQLSEYDELINEVAVFDGLLEKINCDELARQINQLKMPQADISLHDILFSLMGGDVDED